MPLLQLGELLERERVDRPHEAELALELADPGRGGRAVGQRRALRFHGRLGLLVEVLAQGLRGLLQPDPDLGLLELVSLHPLAQLAELAFGPLPLTAEPVEAGGDGSRLLGLAAALLTKPLELVLDDGQAVVDDLPEPVGRGGPQLERRAAPLGLVALVHVAAKALVDLGEAPAEERAALLDARRPHLEVGAEGGDGGGPLVEPGAGLLHGRQLPGPLGLLGLEGGQRRLELRHPLLLARDPLPQLGQVGSQRVGLGHRVAGLGLRRVGGRRRRPCVGCRSRRRP